MEICLDSSFSAFWTFFVHIENKMPVKVLSIYKNLFLWKKNVHRVKNTEEVLF